jgi:protein-disulfide isomerase
MHTHSSDGIIHVESPQQKTMTLGDFFDIWALTVEELSQFQEMPTLDDSTSAYVNGEKASNNYREIEILPNAEIAIVHGLPAPATIPSSYAFGQTDVRMPGNQEVTIQRILAASTGGLTPLGDEDVPVTIVEFGDYQCNSCGIFHKETKDAVISNLVNTGKAKFLFKDFTLNDDILKPRQGSTLAAEAAYCAGDQGKFWEYHDELFNNQEEEGVEWVSVARLGNFAANVGVSDLQAFSLCLDSHQHRSTVNANNALVRDLGINATPTFIVISTDNEGGSDKPVKLIGAYPYASFEAVVNQLLS